MKIIGLDGKEQGNIEFPRQFNEEIRSDIIKRSVEAIQASNKQPYGADKEAGMKASGRISKRRHDYRGSYGYGISRVPRKIFSRRGTRMNWQAAIVPGTVKGRRAHPPKAEKKLVKSINKKERKKAIRCALSAVIDKEIVKKRCHIVPENYPFVIDDKFESLDKTKNVKSAFEKIGLKDELKRVSKRKIRAGKGKLRGRKYKTKKGPLIVVSKKCKLDNSIRNISGVDVVDVKNINCEVLAPGAVPGRLTIFTKSAIEIMAKEKLFM